MDPNDPAVRAKHAAIAGSPRHGKQVCVVVSLGDDKDIEARLQPWLENTRAFIAALAPLDHLSFETKQ